MVGDPLVGSRSLESVDEEVKRLWETVPRMSGEYGVKGPHFWVKYTDKLLPPPPPALRAVVEEDRETPMYKLTNHEVKLDQVGPESCYWVLLEATRRQARGHMPQLPPQLSEAQRLAVVRRLLATGDAVGCH
mmetsp:Transcript_138456/g.441740  ORF Transcript_138456/g.441740 Transcript_138456/m.441740 type:complete len:132 (+) Transcript_138456:675-1070(+)